MDYGFINRDRRDVAGTGWNSSAQGREGQLFTLSEGLINNT